MRKLIAAALAAILATMSLSAVALAAPSFVVVDKAHCGLFQDGTYAHPYCTIQDGVNVVAAGGTVRVLASTYNEDVSVNKQVVLMGPQQTDARTRTVPASQEAVVNGTTNGFLVNASNVMISGFLIQNADTGINLISGLSPTNILRNIFQDNGEGIYLGGNGVGQQFVQLNNFRHNNKAAAAQGSGIYTDQVNNAFVDQNAFSGNQSSAFTSTGFSGVTTNVRFTRNTSTGDGSMTNWYNTDNSVIDTNTATNSTDPNGGFSIFLGGDNDNVQITRNNLHDNVWGGIGARNLRGPNTMIYVDSNTILREAFDGILFDTGTLGGSANQINRNTSDNGQADGIHLFAGITGVKLDSNHMHGNAAFDAEDNSTGNFWTRNYCTTSSPPNLCQFP